MIETALVFDHNGRTICFHEPEGRSATLIPDTQSLWDVLWDHRKTLGGVAHTHPGILTPVPSQEDLTSFAAIELGLGNRLVWPIVNAENTAFYEWIGPERLDYQKGNMLEIYPKGIAELRRRSKFGILEIVWRVQCEQCHDLFRVPDKEYLKGEKDGVRWMCTECLNRMGKTTMSA